MKRRRLMWVGIAVGIAAIILFVAPVVLTPLGQYGRLHSKARKQWKREATATIMTLSADGQMISNEIAILHAEAADKSGDGWIGTNILLMTNGEYLVYSHIDS